MFSGVFSHFSPPKNHSCQNLSSSHYENLDGYSSRGLCVCAGSTSAEVGLRRERVPRAWPCGGAVPRRSVHRYGNAGTHRRLHDRGWRQSLWVRHRGATLVRSIERNTERCVEQPWRHVFEKHVRWRWRRRWICSNVDATKAHSTPRPLRTPYSTRYSKCNSDMWNQEVVEIFLGIIPTIAPLADPTHYIEIEITPHNALFVNNISNPFTNGTAKTNTAIDCGASGIVHSAATFSSESSWTAELSIPLNLAFGSGYTPKAGDLMRVNIFRVVMENDVDACDDSSCAIGCWSSTDTSPSAFHHSNHFGVLRFV